LRARLSATADALYRLESDGDLALLRDPSLLRGRSATVAHEVAASTARLWERYPTVKELVERLDEPSTHDDAARGVDALEADLAVVEDQVRALTRAWADLLPQLDDLTRRATALAAEAAELDAAGEPEPELAQAAVERLADGVAADPLDATVGPAVNAVEQAEAFVRRLRDQRDNLDAHLAEAEATAADIARLIDEGAAALVRARSRIAEPQGLLEPVDPGVLDDGPQALRPWLGRIQEAASRGEWRTASVALERWRTVADGWRANAARVVDANNAPVRRRNELRGLLDAYRAKAVAAGRSEDIQLGRLHEVAHDALHTAPCRLPEAEAAVRGYVEAVTGAG
jgi:prefoldin subunit 5